ncbi:MAG: CotH kinase family protein [Flavobacteriales bacterium]|nr:CotH kinase family protein [Flavobacteriales bacterium]
MYKINFIKPLHLILVILLFSKSIFAQVVDFESSNLPIIIINTEGEEIVDEPKITAKMSIIDNGEGKRNFIGDTPTEYDGFIGIEYRGASSQKWPKKQYGVETRDELGENLDVSIFGMPSENDWVFYAFYVDKTLMLNELMYGLAADMGWYAPRTQYFELVINGEYRGLYLFTEKLKRDKNRVNVAKNKATDEDITGGYFLEMIRNDQVKDDEVYFDMPVEGKRLVVKYPKEDKITDEQLAYISNYFSALDNVLNSDDSADPINGYAKYIDIPSFVDHMLISEAFNQLDVFSHSEYFNKDKGKKLKMGPVWDFDRSIGNAFYYTSWRTDVWWLKEPYGDDVNLWYRINWPKHLMADDNFMEAYANRWFDLRKSIFSIKGLYERIDENIEFLEESRERNFDKWDVIGTDFNNQYVFETYEEEIQYMKSWVSDKFAWLDIQLKDYATLSNEDISVDRALTLLKQNYPNSFSAETTIEYFVPENAKVTLEVYNSMGNLVAVVVNTWQNKGNYSVLFKASNLPAGMYVYKLRVNEHLEFKNMLLVK